MEQRICQSCAMPLTSEDMYATEKDGSVNKDYCKWCYKDGEFVDKVSMEEYIEMCSKFGEQAGMTNEQMKEYCTKVFPTLKRWKKIRIENMFTTGQLYEYLENKTFKKGSSLTAREVANHFNVILPKAIAVLEFGENSCVIVRLDDGNYKARKRSRIPKEVFENFINTDVNDIILNPKYTNKFWVYSKYKDKEKQRILHDIEFEKSECINKKSSKSYDRITGSQAGFIQETGHGRKKSEEWNDKSAREFQKQLEELKKNKNTDK